MGIVPKVSVLMPAYNAEKYIASAIDSILSQSFKDFEFIIINDGSTDKTEQIILSYADQRIRYIKNDINLKLIATLNKGFDLCLGQYIVRMDADDISLPNRIERQVQFMDENPEIGLCGTAFESFGFIEGPYFYKRDDEDIRIRFLHECHMLHPSIILRTEIIRQNNLYMTILHGEDLDFFIRMAQHTKLANLPEILIRYQQLPESMSKANSEITEIHCTKIQLEVFKKINPDFTEDEVRLYRAIAYKDFKSLGNRLYEVYDILRKLLQGNTQQMVLSQKALINYLKELWIQIILNVKGFNLKFYLSISDLNKLLDVNPLINGKALIKNYLK
jgi:glycosyltransferase involved in cell wall biosynthesis